MEKHAEEEISEAVGVARDYLERQWATIAERSGEIVRGAREQGYEMSLTSPTRG